MSKDITDGITLMPLPFAAGLDRWSCENGRPGEATYADLLEASVITDDPTFGSCLQIVKDQPVTRLRYMGETPLLPGCYLKVKARIKVVSGPLPTVRIAGWPGRAGSGAAADHTTTGPAVVVPALDEVVTVSAIVATAQRTGVDLVWQEAIFGHFGIDLTGPNGATVVIDAIEITDVTASFQSVQVTAVDVRDFGAVADAATDATEAFRAADQAAQGREVIVPQGVFCIDGDLTMTSIVRFIGTIVQPDGRHFVLQNGLDFSAYCRAFGDPETAFRKAFHAMSFLDEPTDLDLSGAEISLSGPMDLHAASAGRDRLTGVKTLRNGHLRAVPGVAWKPTQVAGIATYDPDDAWSLYDVENIADIQTGSVVTGKGVGREVYVQSVDPATRSLRLSQPLFGDGGTQMFRFERHKYLLDLSGFQEVSNLRFDNVGFECGGVANGILMAPQGRGCALRLCRINRPFGHAVSSAGTGCVGMSVTSCTLSGNENPSARQETVGINLNGNDVKLHDNTITHFTHLAVVSGAGASITGNQFTGGNHVERSRPTGNLILTKPMCATVITANSFTNATLVWTSEHSAAHDDQRRATFGGLTVTGNSFTTNALAHWIRFMRIAPFGAAHILDGLSVVGNVFRSVNGRINRIEAIDTTHGALDLEDLRAVSFASNTFHGVRDPVTNPAHLVHDQRQLSDRWVADTQPHLPFDGLAKWVDSASMVGPVVDDAGHDVHEAPQVDARAGAAGRQAVFRWSKPVAGKLRYQVRMDDPV